MELMNFVKVFQLERGGQILFYIETDNDHPKEGWAKINQMVQFNEHPSSIGLVNLALGGPWEKMQTVFDNIDKNAAERLAEAIIEDIGLNFATNVNGVEE